MSNQLLKTLCHYSFSLETIRISQLVSLVENTRATVKQLKEQLQCWKNQTYVIQQNPDVVNNWPKWKELMQMKWNSYYGQT